MLFGDHLILLRGGGDLATGVAYRLHKAGFPLVVLELPDPLVCLLYTSDAADE